jgi:hypothetical protein
MTDDEFFFDENTFPKGSSLRHDHELFDDDDDIITKLINVKMVTFGNGKNEDWEILVNGKLALVLKGVRFTVRERKFLKTPQGMLFIIKGYKSGWKSVSEFKRQIQKALAGGK